MASKPSQLPRIATSAGRTVQPPENGTTTTTKDYGFIGGTRPPARFMNWWLNLIYQWCQYLDDIEAQALNWTNHHTFSTASGVSVDIQGGDPTAAVLTVTNNDNGAGGAFYAGPGSVGLFGQGGVGAPGVLAGVAGGNSPAVQGVGAGTGAGVYGIGGSTGPGIKGQGNGGAAGGLFNGGANGPGVWGIAGTGNGQGGLFSGSGSSQGVACTGGPTSGIGLIAAAGGGNASGAQVTGSGSGAGVTATGGATGYGGIFSGGATSGAGVSGTGTGGFVGGVFVGASGASGIQAIGGANGAGVDARGSTTGNTVGVLAQGHGSGGGTVSTGGASSGPGVQGFGGTGNANGVEGTGTGTGAGVKGTGGATGAGVQAIGNAAGITGPAILVTQSHGEADCAIDVTKGTLRFTGSPPLPNVALGANTANGASLVKSTGALTVRFHLGGPGSASVFFNGNGANYDSAQIEVDHTTVTVFFKTPMLDDNFHVSVQCRWQLNFTPPVNTVLIAVPVDPLFNPGSLSTPGTGFAFVLVDPSDGSVKDLNVAPGLGGSDYVVTWEVTGRQ